MKLSAVIPIKNEEQFLTNCLESVRFADEILVLDSGSTDKSLKIARSFKARVVEYDWQGYRYAHNYGAELAQGDWLLYVDADERVSAPLRQSLLNTLKNPNKSAYQMNRRNYIMGQALNHGGWYPDRVTRLIRKEALKGWVGELHEYPEVTGEVGQIEGDLYHLTHRGIDWSLDKTQIYTLKMAEILHQAGHPPVKVKNFLGAMGREFWYRAVKQQGWRDGFIGWLEIFYQTFNAFLVQVQLWELQQDKTIEQLYETIDRDIQKEIQKIKT